MQRLIKYTPPPHEIMAVLSLYVFMRKLRSLAGPNSPAKRGVFYRGAPHWLTHKRNLLIHAN